MAEHRAFGGCLDAACDQAAAYRWIDPIDLTCASMHSCPHSGSWVDRHCLKVTGRHRPCAATGWITQTGGVVYKSDVARRRDVIVRGFFTQLFIQSVMPCVHTATTPSHAGNQLETDIDKTEFDLLDDEVHSEVHPSERSSDIGGELGLTEMTREDGSVASIVYRNGCLIDAAAVDALCVKVHAQLSLMHSVASAC